MTAGIGWNRLKISWSIASLFIDPGGVLGTGKCARKPRQYLNIMENVPDNQWLGCFPEMRKRTIHKCVSLFLLPQHSHLL